jgi:hypothetical protein
MQSDIPAVIEQVIDRLDQTVEPIDEFQVSSPPAPHGQI